MITLAEATVGMKLRCLRDIHTLSPPTGELDLKFREGDEVYVVGTKRRGGVTIIHVNNPEGDQPGVVYTAFEGKITILDEMFDSAYEVVS